MSDYEMLSIVLMILGIVVTILIAYINHTKRGRKIFCVYGKNSSLIRNRYV